MTGPRPISSLWPNVVSVVLRKSLCWVAIVAMCLQFVWLFENYRGARAVRKEVELLEASGESLTWNPESLPGPVPDEDNFGAAPSLRGLMVAPEKYEPLDELEWQDISGIEGLRFGSIGELRAGSWCMEDFRELVKRKPVSWTLFMPQLRKDPPDWLQWRHAMMFSGYFPMISDDVQDEWAVLRGLDKLEPIFGQLAEAALRPHAVFLPAPRERFNGGPPELEDAYWTSPGLRRLSEVIFLRGQAAIACEDSADAARMLRIMLRLSEAADNEYGPYPFRYYTHKLFLAGLPNHTWNAAAMDEFATLSVDERTNLLRAYRLETYYEAMDRNTIEKHPFYRFVRFNLPWFIPQGWEDQGRALNLEINRTVILEPLKAGGVDVLFSAEETWQRLTHSYWASFMRGWFMIFPPTRGYFGDEMKRRILLVAAAAEKARLKRGRYPDSVLELNLPGPAERWLDLDSRPIRYTVADDGKRAAIYSVGFDREDDWKGRPPPEPETSVAKPMPHAIKRGREQPESKPGEVMPSKPVPPRYIAMDHDDQDWVVVLRAP